MGMCVNYVLGFGSANDPINRLEIFNKMDNSRCEPPALTQRRYGLRNRLLNRPWAGSGNEDSI
jgi:hypothetical protein